MLEKVSHFFGPAVIHLGAVGVLWMVLVFAGYAIARLCIKQEVAWQKVVTWISTAMIIVFCGIVLLYLLPKSFTIPFASVVIPNLVCAVALHALLLSVDR